jgi:hypothetical protein
MCCTTPSTRCSGALEVSVRTTQRSARNRENGEPAQVEVRSYRSVFSLERRLYRIDGLPLNPSGIPLRGVAYFALLLGTALVGRWLPVGGQALGLVPWYIRDLFAPSLGAFALSVIRVDGRPFHIVALTLLSYRLGSRRLVGLRAIGAQGRCWHARERERCLWLLPRQGMGRRLQGRGLIVCVTRPPVRSNRRLPWTLV